MTDFEEKLIYLNANLGNLVNNSPIFSFVSGYLAGNCV